MQIYKFYYLSFIIIVNLEFRINHYLNIDFQYLILKIIILAIIIIKFATIMVSIIIFINLYLVVKILFLEHLLQLFLMD